MANPMKYRSKPCTVGAEKYRSQRERDRHQELLLLQRAGQITGLVREVSFELAPKVKIVGEDRARPALRYVADYVYSDVRTGRVVVADAKGMPTPVYRVKKHLMKAVHGVDILEL
jgi:hypothetical protein